MRKMSFFCFWLAAFMILGACQDKTTAKSEQSVPQTSQDNSLLKRLSGRIVFQSDRDGDWDIYVMNVDGSNLVQLTDSPGEDGYPVWSPDGAQIAFESNRDGNFNIYLMQADGSNQRRITDHPADDRSPTWSPDGKQIAFDSARDNDLEVYLMNVDGSGAVQITDKINKDILPDWSPDGKWIAYTGNRYLGWNVYVMNVDQTDDRRITDGHGACRPDWSPDGKKIAYVSQQGDGKGDIWLMNPDGSDKTRVTFDDHNYDYYPAWSPDGKYIAYAKTSDKAKGNWELYIISADGKENAQLTSDAARDTFPDWSSGRVPDELALRQTFVYEAEASPHQIGTAQDDPNASAGRAAYATPADKTGFLVYGPYKSYAPGDYVAGFFLKTDRMDSQEPLAAIDVATDAGATTVAKQDVNGADFLQKNGYQEFQLPFTLTDSKTLEFRVSVSAKGNVWVDKVVVMRKQEKH